jgi:hypothetical protein
MNSTNKKTVTSTVIIAILIGLFSGIGTAWFVFNYYYSPQLQMVREQLQIMNNSLLLQEKQIGIMQQTLQKEVRLILTVVPTYQWVPSVTNNGTVELKNETLTILPYGPTTFTLYVSNVGSAVAHLLFFTVFVSSDAGLLSNGVPTFDIQTVVVKPNEVYSTTYIFNPTLIPLAANATVANFIFAISSSEGVVYQSVTANIWHP